MFFELYNYIMFFIFKKPFFLEVLRFFFFFFGGGVGFWFLVELVCLFGDFGRCFFSFKCCFVKVFGALWIEGQGMGW